MWSKWERNGIDFTFMFNFIIFTYLGAWLPMLGALGVFLVNGINQGRAIVSHRSGEFKKQNMSRSTYINPRKPIVMVKTIAYYFALTVFPKKLGLFHKWGYHYEDRVEKIDWRFFCGVFVLTFFL